MNETRDELAVCIYDQLIFAIGGFGGICILYFIISKHLSQNS